MTTPAYRILCIAFGLMAMLGLAACDDSGKELQGHFDRAVDYRDSGDMRAAVIELKNVLQIDPNHAQARWLLGRSYVALGDGASAQKELERARDLGFTSAELDRVTTSALLLQGHFEDALDRIKKVSASESGAAWLVLKGQAQLGLQNVKEAKESFDAALKNDPTNTDARRGLARIGLMGGDTQAAEQQLDKALQTTKDDVQTWILKGELELALQKPDKAQASFEKALALSPASAGARMGIVRAMLIQSKTNEATAHIDVLAKASPNHPMVNYLRALAARQSNDLDGAQAALREVLRVAPSHAPSLLQAGQIHYMRREFEQAREVLERYLTQLPDNLAAKKLLAAVYIELKQGQKAVDLLGPMATQAPNDPQLLAMLGTAHMSQRDFKTGRDYLGRAADLAPEAAAIRTQLAASHLAAGDSADAITELEAALASNPEFSRADVLLILTHFQSREFDKALAAAQKLVEKQPANAQVRNLLGAAYEGKQDYAMARESYRKSLDLDPGFTTAALNLARLDLRDGKRDQARAAYEAILETQKDQPVALVALAKIASDDGRAQEGVALLERARDKNPRAIQPRLILANYQLRRGNVGEALALAAEAYEISPQLPAAALLLGRAQIANGMPDDAVSTLSELVERYPNSADSHMQLALAYGQKRDVANTRRALNRVLELQPDNPLAILGLGNLALRTGELDEAMKIASELQQSQPKSPAGFNLQGDVLMARNEPGKSAPAYQKALEMAPASATLLKLYAARSRAGQSNATATLSDWLKDHPDDAAVRLAYASTLHQSGKRARAVTEYAQVLKSQPGSVLALNNLAWLYFEDGDSRAVDLAERAYDRAPERAEIIDTYGWLLIKSGRLEQGLSLLEKAAKRAPENGDIRYHLAAGLAEVGDKSRAKRELTALLDSGQAFSEKAAAQALLQELN
ncbi:MAG: PEP-CTERM system TPR-repeat protein PrsT [Lysobacterales bacterium]|nr:MAG: PEP-CTERM system TPR-repeat protein PrsT [Xanthomonadales bacterium]